MMNYIDNDPPKRRRPNSSSSSSSSSSSAPPVPRDQRADLVDAELARQNWWDDVSPAWFGPSPGTTSSYAPADADVEPMYPVSFGGNRRGHMTRSEIERRHEQPFYYPHLGEVVNQRFYDPNSNTVVQRPVRIGPTTSSAAPVEDPRDILPLGGGADDAWPEFILPGEEWFQLADPFADHPWVLWHPGQTILPGEAHRYHRDQTRRLPTNMPPYLMTALANYYPLIRQPGGFEHLGAPGVADGVLDNIEMYEFSSRQSYKKAREKLEALHRQWEVFVKDDQVGMSTVDIVVDRIDGQTRIMENAVRALIVIADAKKGLAWMLRALSNLTGGVNIIEE